LLYLTDSKNKLADVADSGNYKGIALSAILGGIFDYIVLFKYSDKLCTSDLQFGCKQKSSFGCVL